MIWIKILAITPFPPIINGGSMASYNILTRLSQRHSIIVISYLKKKKTSKKIFVRGANFKEDASFFRGLFFILFSLIWGFFYSITLKPDVIYAKNLTSPGISAIILAKFFRTPVVLHSSGPDVVDPLMNIDEMGFFKTHVSQIVLNFLRFEIRDASAIIANCYEDKLAIKKIDTAKNGILIYNRVDTKRFKPISVDEKRRLRKELGLSVNKFITIVVAKFRNEKRYDRVLKLARNFQGEFILLGQTLDELKTLDNVPSNCIPMGTVSNVSEFMKTADIFLLTSDGEGLSNAMLEALSTGVPVISTSVGVAKHILERFYLGYLADTHEERLRILIHLQNNPELLRKLSRKGREYLLRNHEWKRTAVKIERIFKEVVSCE